MNTTTWLGIATTVVAVGTSGCGGTDADRTQRDVGAEHGATDTEALTDEQILEIADVSHECDAEEASQALERASDQVRPFAQTEFDDHLAGVNEVTELGEREGIGFVSSTVAGEIVPDSVVTIAALEDLSGREFDGYYLEWKVTTHERLLGIIDQMLLPQARNEELVRMLHAMRESTAQHLEAARASQEASTEPPAAR